MTKDEARKLPIGLYTIYWKDNGGVSKAAVGMLYNGTRWFAPVNWTSTKPDGVVSTDWRYVDSVERVT